MGRETRLHLNLFVKATGHHQMSWLHPGAAPERLHDIGYYRDLAALAERGRFDSLFLADVLSISRDVKNTATETSLEPLTLLSALAALTEHVGLIGTCSTSFTEPYNLARQFASLDHISRGRAGWNIVTSYSVAGAANFGQEGLLDHHERYARGTEFVEIVTGLWDGWEDGARVIDRANGIHADTARIHALDHVGQRFRVRGPLDLPRPPQGWPVLVQAGSSEDGRAFAARFAEAIFTAQHEIPDAKAFYDDVKGRAVRIGRDPALIKILPGLSPIVAGTEAEAKRKQAELDALLIPEVGLQRLSLRFDGFDFSPYPLDGPVPLDKLPKPEEIRGAQSRTQIFRDLVIREKLTLRGLLQRFAGAQGHKVLAGTPEQIADHIVSWVEQGAADGFNVMPPYFPGALADFVDGVIPELQRRGVFRTDYEGATLREHYGLPRPPNRFTAGRGSAAEVGRPHG